MATVEFLQKRIESKKSELEKLNKKLKRIQKAEVTNWKVNPYYYNSDDIGRTQKEITAAEKTIKDYEADLDITIRKDNSRNVQIIIEFINNWKERCFKFYTESFQKYLKANQEWCEYASTYCEWFNKDGHRASAEERTAKDKEYKIKRAQFYNEWNFILPYITSANREYVLNENKIRKDLEEEGKRKYDFIINKTIEIVGTITDASNLHVGDSGELNGYIIGTSGRASVKTISAEGEVQCFHYRTLIHEMN